MSYRTWIAGISPLRRLAFWLACVSWVIWASWFRFAFSEAAITRWSQPEVAAFVLVGATATAAVVLEMARLFIHRQWTDTRHFTVAAVVAVALFGIQYAGLSLMLQAFAR
jgi:hypothetical protein